MLTEKEQEKIVRHYSKNFEVKQKEMRYIPDESDEEFKVDLFWIRPRKHYPFHTLATMGLSNYHMENCDNQYIELIMVMPESWRIADDNGEHVWQVSFLRNVAREISKNKLTLKYGDLLLTTNTNETISPTTNMYCGLIVLPEVYSTKIFKLKFSKEKAVKFYALTTLTQSEFEKAQQKNIYDFIDEDFSTEDGTNIFVLEKRNPAKKTKDLPKKKEKILPEEKGNKTKSSPKKTSTKSRKVIIKNKKQ